MPRHSEASLNNLPMEVVDMITSYLDTDAKIALALTSARLRDFAFEWLQRVKPKVYSQTTRNYLKYNGFAVLELDFSNWVIPPCILSSLILHCQNISELNVVGTTLSCREIVGAAAGLRKLNALSFSLLNPMNQPRTYSDHNTTGPTNSLMLRVVDDPLSRKRFLNLKNLYVEIVGNVNSYDFVVDLMNRCSDLEVAHITMIVSQRSRQPENYFLTLSPDRWRTLRTFVLSNFDPSRQGCSQSAGLLTRIFGDRLVDGHILRWVLEKKDCYIYENANFNGNRSSREARDLGGVLIEKLQRISLVSDDETFSKPWGSPQKLRIVSQNGVSTSQVRNILTHPRPWSLNVVELDLSEGHSFDYQNFSHFDLITLSPSLEAIALSPCFLGSSAQADKGSYQRVSGPTGRRPPELDLLDSRLGKLRLKKFCLKGSLMCIDCLTTALTASSIPDLTGLKWLQEIILNSVLLDGSAYDFLSNPNVRTLKLVLRWKSDFYGLTNLIKRCTKLRNLKLESSILPLQCKFMWRAFAECETLQQLCLGARNRIMMDVPQSAYDRENILRFVGQLVERLKVLHMHSSLSIYSKSAPPFNLHDVVRNMMISSALSEPKNETRNGRFVGPDQTSLAETDFLEDPPTFVGRGLCSPESFIGVVEPKGWTID